MILHALLELKPECSWKMQIRAHLALRMTANNYKQHFEGKHDQKLAMKTHTQTRTPITFLTILCVTD